MEWTQTTPQLKRRASDDLLPQQRLRKRLETLSLRTHPLTLDISASHSTASSTNAAKPKRERKPKPPDAVERMDVDNVVYISDIDAELSSDDEDPETKGKLVFIPDIERELTRIPHHVLRPRKDDKDTSAGDGGKGQALVLYSDPRSLSVVEEKDSVRKAIIESRARLRMKQAAENEARLLATEAGQEEVQPQSLAPPPVIGTGFPGGGYAGFGAEMINSGGGGVVSGWYGGTNSINNGGGGGGGGYDSDVDMDAMDVE